MTTIRNAFRKILNTMDMPAPFVEPSLKERLKILRVPRIIAAHEVHLRSILVNDGLLQQSQKAKPNPRPSWPCIGLSSIRQGQFP
jgi:hypothetical protein